MVYKELKTCFVCEGTGALLDSLFLLGNRPVVSMAAGSSERGRHLARLPALTHPQDNCITGTFGKEKMKSFLRSRLFPQEIRGVLSTKGDAKESESRASALEDCHVLGGQFRPALTA